jgi:hypothetical protein
VFLDPKQKKSVIVKALLAKTTLRLLYRPSLSDEPKYVKIGGLEPERCGDNGNIIK